jgi:hypothetical protein
MESYYPIFQRKRIESAGFLPFIQFCDVKKMELFSWNLKKIKDTTENCLNLSKQKSLNPTTENRTKIVKKKLQARVQFEACH